MADEKQLALLRSGVDAWNEWRREHPDEQIDLSRVDLRSAFLMRANLSGAKLIEAHLGEAHLVGANLIDADLSGAVLFDANLRSAHLSGATLRDANLTGANLIEADLRGALLIGADLRRAPLLDANLSGANLLRANLSGANLFGADLTHANLIEADLSGANLLRADLTGANLRDGNFTDAKLDVPLLRDYVRPAEDLEAEEKPVSFSSPPQVSTSEVCVLRIGIDGRWEAKQFAAALIALDSLYSIHLELVVQRAMRSARVDGPPRLVGDIAIGTSLGPELPDSSQGLLVHRILDGSPGFTDLTGVGAVVGHLKDTLLRAIEICTDHRHRELQNDKRALENEQLRIALAEEYVRFAKEAGCSDDTVKAIFLRVVAHQQVLLPLIEEGKITSVEVHRLPES